MLGEKEIKKIERHIEIEVVEGDREMNRGVGRGTER